jgi:hypothetical protein
MNVQNYSCTPNPDVPGDWIIKGDIYDENNILLGTFGPDGTSVFTWWNQQTVDFQLAYVSQFSSIMARQIAYGDAI